jgi:hypothetical protein
MFLLHLRHQDNGSMEESSLIPRGQGGRGSNQERKLNDQSEIRLAGRRSRENPARLLPDERRACAWLNPLTSFLFFPSPATRPSHHSSRNPELAIEPTSCCSWTPDTMDEPKEGNFPQLAWADTLTTSFTGPLDQQACDINPIHSYLNI